MTPADPRSVVEKRDSTIDRLRVAIRDSQCGRVSGRSQDPDEYSSNRVTVAESTDIRKRREIDVGLPENGEPGGPCPGTCLQSAKGFPEPLPKGNSDKFFVSTKNRRELMRSQHETKPLLVGQQCLTPSTMPANLKQVIADKNTFRSDGTKQSRATGTRPTIQKRQQTAKARKVSGDAIHEVFNYWREKISPRSRAVLDEVRKTKIGWAIHDYGIEACKQAIDGCLKSGWHMGNNPSQKKYNDVELIFRHAANVERFISMADQRDAKQEFINNPDW